MGSTIDTTSGKVLLTIATTRHGTQFGEFDRGAFVVTQKRSGLASLVLAGGPRQTPCPATSAANGISPAVLRRLHGHSHGDFRTVGNYASAAVRGTDWTTTDRCDGTLLTDNAGKIDTETNNGAVGAVDLHAVSTRSAGPHRLHVLHRWLLHRRSGGLPDHLSPRRRHPRHTARLPRAGRLARSADL